jgi:hypothetical protein
LRHHEAAMAQYLNQVNEFQAKAVKFIADGAAAVQAGTAPQPFSCQGRSFGYYADILSGCQNFHICQPQSADSIAAGLPEPQLQTTLRCPNETLFDQKTLTCARAEDFKINCAQQTSFYTTNSQFGAQSTLSAVPSAPVAAPIVPEEQPIVYSNSEAFPSASYETAPIEAPVAPYVTNHRDQLSSHYSVEQPAAFAQPTIEPVIHPGQPANIYPAAVGRTAHVSHTVIGGHSRSTIANHAYTRGNQPGASSYLVDSAVLTSSSNTGHRARPVIAAAPEAHSQPAVVPIAAAPVEESPIVESVANNPEDGSFSSEEIPSASAQPDSYAPDANSNWAVQPSAAQPQPETNIYWATQPAAAQPQPETNIYWATQPNNAINPPAPSVASAPAVAYSSPAVPAPVATHSAPATAQASRAYHESPIARARRLRV